MTDIQIRPEVVALLVDVTLDREAYLNRTMTHDDGRPVTDAEYELIGSANVAEMGAMLQYSARVREIYEERDRDVQRAVQIMQPYFDRVGPQGTVSDVRKICTPQEDAELGAIFERTCPDGYIYL